MLRHWDIASGSELQLNLERRTYLISTYDVLLDEEGNVARDHGVAGLPTTFIFDRNGKLYTRILGESTPEVFEKIIKELL